MNEVKKRNTVLNYNISLNVRFNKNDMQKQNKVSIEQGYTSYSKWIRDTLNNEVIKWENEKKKEKQEGLKENE
ncbi:MAG: hypothetical protein RR478_05570 [Bacilli bacterium]